MVDVERYTPSYCLQAPCQPYMKTEARVLGTASYPNIPLLARRDA